MYNSYLYVTKPPFFVEHAIHSENEARNVQSGEYTSTCNEAASIAVLDRYRRSARDRTWIIYTYVYM